MAKVDEAFSYLRSQSEGRGGKASNSDVNQQTNDVNGRRSESTSGIQNESKNSCRNERAGSITIPDAVVDSSKDYDSLEQTEIFDTDLDTSKKR